MKKLIGVLFVMALAGCQSNNAPNICSYQITQDANGDATGWSLVKGNVSKCTAASAGIDKSFKSGKLKGVATGQPKVQTVDVTP